MECKDFEPSIIQDNENEYININKVAEAKGLKSNRSLRLEINKPELIILLNLITRFLFIILA